MSNKRKEMIQLLDSISKFNTISKYSNSLKKIFKNKTLKDYIKTLRNPIHFESFKFITDFEKRTKKEEEEDEYNLLPKGYLKKGKKEINLLHDENAPEPEVKKDINKDTLYENSAKSMTNFNLTIMKQHYHELDPFKYNPNYNSIYKNVPSFKIILPKKKTIKKNSKSQCFLTGISDKKIKNIKKLNIKIHNDNALNENDKKNRIYYLNNSLENNIKNINYKNLPILRSPINKNKNNKKIKNKNKFKNNHAFRFSKYMPRKINIYKVNNRLTYLEQNINSFSDKNNNAIDFNKMETRDSNKWVNLVRLSNPSIYYYSPRYDSIEKKPLNIFFNPKDTFRNNKKYIIKKIWTSYKVKKEYESIDNSKLIY